MKDNRHHVKNSEASDRRQPSLQKHLCLSALILSSFLLFSCKTAPFSRQQDINCARLILKTDNISIIKEEAEEGATGETAVMAGNDNTADSIIPIQPSAAQSTDEDTDMEALDFSDYTDYDEDKIVDLDDEPFFVPPQPAEPAKIQEAAEDGTIGQEVKSAAVSAQQNEAPGTAEGTPEGAGADEIKGPEGYIKLASAYTDEGKYEEALAAYKKASAMLAPGDPDIHYSLGLTYLNLNDRDSALNEYKILISSSPVKADTLYRKTVEKILSEKDNRFTVQVGAYKDINNAYNAVKRLQKNHIYAYIKKENSFNKVRIPGIKARKDGEALLKELRNKFGFRSVLLNAR